MSNWIGVADVAIDAGASTLDRGRIRLLQIALGWLTVRRAYTSRWLRHSLRLAALSLICFPLAVLRPDILLIAGPLIFGYSHLISSYRFVRTGMQPKLQFRVFLFATFAALIARYATSHGLGEQWPGGALEALVASVVVALVAVRNGASWLGLAAVGIFTALAVRFAWQEPILFVGGILIFHNWIAFFTWLTEAPEGADRRVAITATILFALVHGVVFLGTLDPWLSLDRWSAIPGGAWQAGWILSGGADNAILLYRAVVLYTFGISLHYFIWLRVIPECRSQIQAPTSFRRSLNLLRNDLGSRTFLLVSAVGIAGTILWCVNPVMGAAIYFGWAALHGWLEAAYLLARINLRVG